VSILLPLVCGSVPLTQRRASRADKYVNLDDGWAIGRNANGTLKHDPELFPHGIKIVADYVHSKGMLFGIYTARGSGTCMGRPGSVRPIRSDDIARDLQVAR
jgi:hypothetical protein